MRGRRGEAFAGRWIPSPAAAAVHPEEEERKRERGGEGALKRGRELAFEAEELKRPQKSVLLYDLLLSFGSNFILPISFLSS